MGDERCGVYPTLFNQAKDFPAIATVHATSLEDEVLAIHVWQRKHLWLVVEGHHGDNGIGSGTLPREAESAIGSGHFKHTVGSAMAAMLQDKVLAFLGNGEQHIGVMLLHEAEPFFRLLADDDTLGLLQHYAKERADARRSCSYDQDGIILGNL